MRWPRRSMVCTKRKLFTAERLGKPRPPWSSPLWSGCHGLTTSACLDPSATFHRLRLKSDTTDNLQHRLRNLFYFNQTASAIPGAIHLALSVAQIGVRVNLG